MTDYLEAWERGDTDRMLAVTADHPAELAETVEAFDRALIIAERSHQLGDVTVSDGDRATAEVSASLALAGLGDWSHGLTVELVQRDGTWLIDWSLQTVHPELGPDRRATRTRTWPPRAPVLGHDGRTLAGPTEVVVVSLHGERITDRGRVLRALVELTPATEDEANQAVADAERNPTWRIPVVAMRRPDFENVRDELFPVPGVVFPTEERHLQVEPDLAEHVIGTVGPITEELLEEFGEPYLPTDLVGRSGLELAYERQLAGRPSGEVRIVDPAGEVLEVLHRFEGEPARPLRTTLDLDVQRAAEAAAAGVDDPTAVVVVHAPSGAIRAAASRPIEGQDLALTGRYPPGSTFKVVTSGALLTAGLAPSETVPCPGQITVDGKVFGNAHDLAAGDITFREAFEISCNTAFVELALGLPDGALGTAAERFGFGADYPGFPLPVAGGRFPPTGSRVERAAAAIGQGQVLTSPLHNATVAAAVQTGRWQPPSIVLGQEDAASPAPTGSPGALHADTLADLMRRVVASGTGTAADVAADVHGKTGTAEFGTGDPPPTHAWFIGFRGELAFAVLVEGGGGGGDVAAPIAAELLRALDG